MMDEPPPEEAKPRRRGRVVDSHSHWSPPALLEVLEQRSDFPRLRRERCRTIIDFAPGQPHELADDMWNAGVKLRKMDRDGIDLAVISAVGATSVIDLVDKPDAPSAARQANEELADLVRDHSERFAGLAALPMHAGEKAVEELEHAVTIGLKGAMLHSNIAGRTLDEPEFRPIFETAARLGVPIQIHPTYPLSAEWLQTDMLITAVGFMFDSTTAALRLIFDGIYDELPDLKLQLCHAGSLLPYLIGRIDRQAQLFPSCGQRLTAPPGEHIRKLYADTVSGWPPALRLTLDVFGADHVMFGTDEPYWPGNHAFETIDALELSPAEIQQIETETASRFFRLEAA
jgi:aminocarboxymuconate-semialdehyde decarboxylase